MRPRLRLFTVPLICCGRRIGFIHKQTSIVRQKNNASRSGCNSATAASTDAEENQPIRRMECRTFVSGARECHVVVVAAAAGAGWLRHHLAAWRISRQATIGTVRGRAIIRCATGPDIVVRPRISAYAENAVCLTKSTGWLNTVAAGRPTTCAVELMWTLASRTTPSDHMPMAACCHCSPSMSRSRSVSEARV